MTFHELDFIFPFVVFGYGFVVTFVLNSPQLLTIAEERMSSELYQQLKARKAIGSICLLVGGLWALQNLWLS
jgi:hypothetical protein